MAFSRGENKGVARNLSATGPFSTPGSSPSLVLPGAHALRPARLSVLKTLPGSESSTGKPRRRLSHHWSNRVETHTANAQDSATPVPWRWRSRAARIRESSRPKRASRSPQRAEDGTTGARFRTFRRLMFSSLLQNSVRRSSRQGTRWRASRTTSPRGLARQAACALLCSG
jgi:hypothetical protein